LGRTLRSTNAGLACAQGAPAQSSISRPAKQNLGLALSVPYPPRLVPDVAPRTRPAGSTLIGYERIVSGTPHHRNHMLNKTSRGASIDVMETSEDRRRPDLASHGAFRFNRSIQPQSAVGPLFVVVAHELLQDAQKVRLVEHDHVVETFSAKRAHYPFGDGVCLGRSDRAEQSLYAKPLGPGCEITAIDAVPVTE